VIAGLRRFYCEYWQKDKTINIYKMKRNNYSNLSEAFDDAFETVYYYGLEWILEEGVEPKTDAEMDALEADVNARSRRGELVYTNDWSAEFKRYIGDDRARGRGSVALKYISERMGITRKLSAILAYAWRRYQMGLEEEAERRGRGVRGEAGEGGVEEGGGESVREMGRGNGSDRGVGEGAGIDSSKSFRLSDLCRMETQVDCVYKGMMTYDSDDGYEGCYDDSSEEARQRALKYAGDLEELVKMGFIRKEECKANSGDGCQALFSAKALGALSKENEAIGGREFLYQMEDSVAWGIESDADFDDAECGDAECGDAECDTADTRSEGAGLSEGEGAKGEGVREGGEGMREGGEAEVGVRVGAEACGGTKAGAEGESVDEGGAESVDYPIGLYMLLRQDVQDLES
jgi:hypothetical protein